MKQLTEAQAWREIARDLEKRGAVAGLCRELRHLYYDGRISDALYVEMRAHLDDFAEEAVGTYYWDFGDTTPRIIAAVLLAEEVGR